MSASKNEQFQAMLRKQFLDGVKFAQLVSSFQRPILRTFRNFRTHQIRSQ
jgi:hypothetical protein